LRRLKRRRSDALAEGNEEPLYDATDVEMRVDICRLIAKLPDTYREVVILRDIEGLSAEETAGELGISIEAAKSRLHRGRF
jgi:RNA polymerase sigma factor (sigma-70 family)